MTYPATASSHIVSASRPGDSLRALAAVVLCCSGLWMVAPAAGKTKAPKVPVGAFEALALAAGLSPEEAARHLLDRLTFGARPGEIDQILEFGLERWFETQISGGAGGVPEACRGRLPAWELTLDETVERYPPIAQLLREATAAGVLPEGFDPQNPDPARRDEFRRGMQAFARDNGYGFQRELMAQVVAHKLCGALHAEGQLNELLVDFWFNHFNVSITDPQVQVFVLDYEREAIRPHALGRFPDLLLATARHPAMLMYLDNAQSTAEVGRKTTLAGRRDARRGRRAGSRNRFGFSPRGADLRRTSRERQPPAVPDRPRGLNENYARELLELHTLGVDGGYDQQDVVEVARALTGWAVYPYFADPTVRARVDLARRSNLGFVVEDGFLFRPDAHDAEAKEVLGHRLAPGRGREDGEELLAFLAAHPATAEFVSRKLAVRFVSDHPPEALVDHLATVFRATGGDVRQLLRALVLRPEFWSADSVAQKIRSPFELVAASLRATDAQVDRLRGVIDWITRMGQPLYAYQAPTGYPDRADHWVNTGSLLQRMNFGLALAAGNVDGVRIDLLSLVDGREPASHEEALATYLAVLLPERGADETFELLRPMVAAPELQRRVREQAEETQSSAAVPSLGFEDWLSEPPATGAGAGEGEPGRALLTLAGRDALERVVGLILGSPEFQRR